jgi:hypothetical protein
MARACGDALSVAVWALLLVGCFVSLVVLVALYVVDQGDVRIGP